MDPGKGSDNFFLNRLKGKTKLGHLSKIIYIFIILIEERVGKKDSHEGENEFYLTATIPHTCKYFSECKMYLSNTFSGEYLGIRILSLSTWEIYSHE
jgi:hypothetical protein